MTTQIKIAVMFSSIVLLICFSFDVIAQPQPGTQPAPEEYQSVINRMAEDYHLGPPASNEQRATLVTARETGTQAYWQRYPNGSIYLFRGEGRSEVGGVYLVHGTILTTYAELQYHDSRLGFPMSAEIPCRTPDSRDRFQRYERGIMYWRASTNQARPYYGNPEAWPDSVCNPATAESRNPSPRGAAPSTFRITLLGFQCDEQTDDDIFEGDGKGDEVYLLVNVAKYNRSGARDDANRYRTVLMGANTHKVDQNRMVVGNLGEEGGIGNGFRFMPRTNPPARYRGLTLPMVVYEGRIDEGMALMIVPTIWEWDGEEQFLQGYDRQITERLMDGPNMRNFVRVAIEHGIPEGFGPGPLFHTNTNSFGYWEVGWTEVGGDRPVGFRDWQGRLAFRPNFLLLMNSNAASAASAPGSLPRLGEDTPGTSVEALYDARFLAGLITVSYGNSWPHRGKYWLFLKVEKLN